MTDLSSTGGMLPEKETSKSAISKHTRRRYAAEARFKYYGIAAIGISILFLITLLVSIISNGIPAFTQTFIAVEITLDQAEVDEAEKSIVKTSKYRAMITRALAEKVANTGYETDLTSPEQLRQLMSSGSAASLRDRVLTDPSLIGQSTEYRFLTSSRVDGYLKGRVTRESLARDKNLTPEALDLVDQMQTAGFIKRVFNWDFITGSDASDSRPEEAGIGVS
ncbi:MAG: DUF3333 domain-containing protein, partial [Pseudomonadota bacterium]